jgi:hypothetical protein
MSEVISFRLDDKNPREAQAREVLNAWVEMGYSVRSVLTESLLRLDREEMEIQSNRMDNIAETVDRLSSLIEKLEGRLEPNQTEPPTKPALNPSFVSSIKMAAKPSLRIEN